MSSKWPIVRIDDIKANKKNAITIGPFGSRMKSDCYAKSGIGVIRGTNIGPTPQFINDFVYITEEKANELASCKVYKDDLVFPHRGSIGEVGIVDHEEQYVISSSLMKLTCAPDKACSKFIYYFFKSNVGRYELLKNASQVGTPGIGQPLSSLKSIELSLPPLKTQYKIAGILSRLDEKIQLNNRINQTLEQMAQALFKSWFVDFEPVKAKIAVLEGGGSLEEATFAAMTVISKKDIDSLITFQSDNPEQYAELKATAELFPSVMQASELGDIPLGWEATTFGSVSKCFDKYRVPLSKTQRDNVKGIIPYYGATSIMDYVNEHIFDGIYLLLGEDGSVLKEDDTPFTQYIWGQCWVNNHAHVLQGNDYISTEHLLLFIKTQNIAPYVTGAVQLKLNQKNMNKIPFVKPSQVISNAFNFIIEPLFSMFRNKHDESISLGTIRDELLPKLLSGVIDLEQDI